MENLNNFSEIYINLSVKFELNLTSQRTDRLKAKVQEVLGEAFEEIEDDHAPEGAWGYKNADSTMVVGYTSDDRPKTHSITVIARVHDIDGTREVFEKEFLSQTLLALLKSEPLKSATFYENEVESYLYFTPFEDHHNKELLFEKLAKELAPSWVTDQAERRLSAFEMSLATAYVDGYTKENRYMFATNRTTGRNALESTLKFVNNTEGRSPSRVMQDMNSIDIHQEIQDEARHLEQARKVIEQ